MLSRAFGHIQTTSPRNPSYNKSVNIPSNLPLLSNKHGVMYGTMGTVASCYCILACTLSMHKPCFAKSWNIILPLKSHQRHDDVTNSQPPLHSRAGYSPECAVSIANTIARPRTRSAEYTHDDDQYQASCISTTQIIYTIQTLAYPMGLFVKASQFSIWKLQRYEVPHFSGIIDGYPPPLS